MKKWVTFIFFLAYPAYAAELDPDRADKVFDSCPILEKLTTQGSTDDQDVLAAGVCRGFVIGRLRTPIWSTLCTPTDGFIVYDLALIFNAYVKKNPVWRTRSAQAAFDAAMEDAFPCSSE